MRLIPSRKIRDGVELARDVVAGPPGTAPLLRAGVRLSARYAELLPKAGVGSVWIEDDLGEAIDIAEPLTAETRAKVTAPPAQPARPPAAPCAPALACRRRSSSRSPTSPA